MLPSSFGQSQLDDIKAFIAYCEEKRSQDPQAFEHMTAYIVGSRVWMADLLAKPELDDATKATIQAMVSEADCDVRFEPTSIEAENKVTLPILSRLRNLLLDKEDPSMESYANFDYRSLDIALVLQRATLVNGLDHRVDAITFEKYFDSPEHKAAYERWLNERVIDAVGLDLYLEKAKKATVDAQFPVVSMVERTLRSYIKPLKVGVFSPNTAAILYDFLFDESYIMLKANVSRLIMRRVWKKLMPSFVTNQDDIYGYITSHVQKILQPYMAKLEADYEELSNYIETVTKTMEAYYQRKFKALIEYINDPALTVEDVKHFSIVAKEPLNTEITSKRARLAYLEKAVSDLTKKKQEIMSLIDTNEDIVKRLSDLAIAKSRTATLPVPKIIEAKQPRIRPMKKTIPKQKHPQIEEDLDQQLECFTEWQQRIPEIIAPVEAKIVYDKAKADEYAQLIQINKQTNADMLILYLGSKKTVHELMSVADSSFLHVIAVLKNLHNPKEVDFYAKRIIQNSHAYSQLSGLPRDSVNKLAYERKIDAALSQAVIMLPAVTGGVDPRNYVYESFQQNVVYQELASCNWPKGPCLEHILNITGMMRLLSHTYHLKECAKGLFRAVFADHHFELRKSFPLKLKDFIDWLFTYNPLYSPAKPHLNYVDIKLMVDVFFPNHEISKELCAYILTLVKQFSAKSYQHIEAPRIADDLKSIKNQVLLRVKDVHQTFLLRQDRIEQCPETVIYPSDIFENEIHQIKFNQDMVANMYHVLYFFKHTNYSKPKNNETDWFAPINELLSDSDTTLLKDMPPADGKKAHERNIHAINEFVYRLMLALQYLGITISAEEDANLTAQEYQYAAMITGNCIRSMISIAIAMSDNPVRKTELLVIYNHVRHERVTNLLYYRIFAAIDSSDNKLNSEQLEQQRNLLLYALQNRALEKAEAEQRVNNASLTNKITL